MRGAIGYSERADLRVDHLLSSPSPPLISLSPSACPLPSSLSPERKRVAGPSVIGRFGGTLSVAFELAGAHSKAAESSATPPGRIVPFLSLPRGAEN